MPSTSPSIKTVALIAVAGGLLAALFVLGLYSLGASDGLAGGGGVALAMLVMSPIFSRFREKA